MWNGELQEKFYFCFSNLRRPYNTQQKSKSGWKATEKGLSLAEISLSVALLESLRHFDKSGAIDLSKYLKISNNAFALLIFALRWKSAKNKDSIKKIQICICIIRPTG